MGVRLLSCFLILAVGSCQISGPPIYSSCKQAAERACNPVNGVYSVKATIDEGFIKVYCRLQDDGNQKCPGIGWTPVLKINESIDFNYSSPYWSNREVLSPSEWETFNSGTWATKLPTYWSTNFTEICIKNTADGSSVVIPYAAHSLESLIADGVARPTNVPLSEWASITSGGLSAIYFSIYAQGFNVGESALVTRLGVVSETDLGLEYSAIGTGLKQDSRNNMNLDVPAGYLSGGAATKLVYSVYVR